MLLESLFTSCLSAYKVTVAVSCLFLKPSSELAYASTQFSTFMFVWKHIRRKTFLPYHRMILRFRTYYLKESALWDVKRRVKNIHWGQTKDIIFTDPHHAWQRHLTHSVALHLSTAPFSTKKTSCSNTVEDFTYILANKLHNWDPYVSSEICLYSKTL